MEASEDGEELTEEERMCAGCRLVRGLGQAAKEMPPEKLARRVELAKQTDATILAVQEFMESSGISSTHGWMIACVPIASPETDEEAMIGLFSNTKQDGVAGAVLARALSDHLAMLQTDTNDLRTRLTHAAQMIEDACRPSGLGHVVLITEADGSPKLIALSPISRELVAGVVSAAEAICLKAERELNGSDSQLHTTEGPNQ